MKTTLSKIYTQDNLELSGLLYEPDAGSNTVLVHVHGMAGNFYENKFLDHIAKTLTDNGIAFFAFNNRGTEYVKDMYRVESDTRTTVRLGDTFEKFEDCVLDIKAAMDFVAQEGFSEIHLSGHSLGGPKVAYYVAKEKDVRVTSVIFLSPADMVGLARADKNFERDVSSAKRLIEEGKGNEILPDMVWDDCLLSAKSYMSLTSASSDVAIFNFYNPEDTLPVLGTISIPSLTVLGRKDHVLIIPIEKLLERVKIAMTASPRVETVILGDADHGYNGHEQQLAGTLNAWISKF